jgi:peptidoglycan/LPS O-acetylase OafA/YrhL
MSSPAIHVETVAPPARRLTSNQPVEMRKPARLNALTGLRCLAALNIVFFHFSNPDWFGWFAPVVNAGFASVSFFILLSGFVLAYNYAGRSRAGKLDKGRFWTARITRLYPVYLLSLVLGFEMLPVEHGAHTQGMFWTGVALTPVLLQGWIPQLATFWNTPAWTMSAEGFFYLLFPWLARWKRPDRVSGLLARMGGIWVVGMIPGLLYIFLKPDGIAHPDRWSWGPWLQALKYTPLPHMASFVFGILLADLDELVGRAARLRLILGGAGIVAVIAVLELGPLVPYPLLHDSLLMPLFGCVILGLAGENLLSTIFSLRPLVFVGEASYCLYLLHFNLWNMLHDSHILDRLNLSRFDPWLSYALLIAMAVATLHLIEKPAQRWLRKRVMPAPAPVPMPS